MLYIIYNTLNHSVLSKAIVLSRVSSSHQDLTQQTDEILREVHRDGYEDRDIIIIEDTESAINLSVSLLFGEFDCGLYILYNNDVWVCITIFVYLSQYLFGLLGKVLMRCTYST